MFDEDIWRFINMVYRDGFGFGGMTVLSTFVQPLNKKQYSWDFLLLG